MRDRHRAGPPTIRCVNLDELIRWVHLTAATVWVGGMITMAALIPVLRKGGVSIEIIRAGARRFGHVTWIAITISVVTGILQLFRFDYDLTVALTVKLILVSASITLAFVHQEIAKYTSPALRGAMEGILLLLGVGILGAAVAI
jgi:uncharacterized membrane protein